MRISKARFALDRLPDVEHALAASEAALRVPLESMSGGLVQYYVGIDRVQGQMTNVSVWASMDDALAMATLQPMLAQRPIMEAAGCVFETITNHDDLWTITP